jgi:cell division septation protein DedD
MGQYSFPELEETGGSWRKAAKVTLVIVVFCAAFLFAFFKVGPWVKGWHAAPEDAVLSDAAASSSADRHAESPGQAGPSASRVWIAPHEAEPGANGVPEQPEPQIEPKQPGQNEPGAGGASSGLDESGAAEPTQPPEEEPSLPPRSTTKLYRVQVGVFSEKDRAEELSGELVEKGYSTYVSQTQSGGKVLYKVQVGAFEDEENAKALADELNASGYDVVVTSSSG